MKLFKKAQPVKQETEWQDCVDYLRDLQQTDYNKILKVVDIYRGADKGVKKVLGIKDKPGSEDLDGIVLDDTTLGDFLEDEQPKPKVTKVEVQ